LPEQFVPFKAQVVVANILAKPLIELSPVISELVADQGDLILSGILNEQADSVADAYRQLGFVMADAVRQDDWCRLDGVNQA
jgi:ribosomal protein L11 methyltransferase